MQAAVKMLIALALTAAILGSVLRLSVWISAIAPVPGKGV